MTSVGLRHQKGIDGKDYLWYDTGSGYSASHLGVFKLANIGRPREEEFSRYRWSTIGYTALVRWEDD